MKTFRILIIIIVLITLYFALKWFVIPKIYVTPIPPLVIESKIDERQAILIEIKNISPFPIKIVNAYLILNQDIGRESIYEIQKGIIFEEAAISYKFLSEGNPYWDELKRYNLNNVKIKPFQEANVYFLTQLKQNIGLVEEVVIHFSYLGNYYEATIKDVKLAILSNGASNDLKRIINKYYPGSGLNIKHKVVIRKLMME
ncbi:hypothetical protein BHF71_10830 [Vulcanibacillus modesticaldus]|uniref:Uncharacterized protein n=1 Tax=Vulcanibacillus modesticaldus TaxID=337097 RepID=A0A1D2YSZ4_9BACI|nr:hypothetical protein [Vulcanibacillus modesticaldus]OEF98813.1 hypothetical protein BHF71_10830 [Vulcanibacillus modesticaldus]